MTLSGADPESFDADRPAALVRRAYLRAATTIAAGSTDDDDVQYDVIIAKTLTRPDTPLVGNFTLFLENFYQTDLDGSTSGHTVVALTPRVRFNLGKVQGVKLGLDNWLLFGLDVPVAGPIPYDAVYRFTNTKNF